jgi:hypothetical protein
LLIRLELPAVCIKSYNKIAVRDRQSSNFDAIRILQQVEIASSGRQRRT